MSLLRLLTAGKSLVGLSDSTSRYRMAHRRAMPKFGSAKNPFRAKSGPESAQSPVASERNEAAEALANGVEATVRAESHSETSNGDGAKASAKPDQLGAPVAMGQGGRAGRPSLVDRWIAKADGWLSKARNRPAKPAIPRFTKSPVQGELRLDQIKVVRNDLSDSDVDVVAAKSKAAAPATRALTEGGAPAHSGKPRGRMATRLFGAGKT